MSWTSVALIKNDLNEYRFAVLPNLDSYYSGHSGSSHTTIRIGGYREQNSEPGSAKFQLGLSYVESIYNQISEGIYNRFDAPNDTYDNFLYGKAAGEALRLYIVKGAESSTNYGYNLNHTVYWDNMQSSLRIIVGSGSIDKDQSKNQYQCMTFFLFINHDTEECYLAQGVSMLHWASEIGRPKYYDGAEVVITVIDSGGADSRQNLYHLFRDSIPSGAGSDPYAQGGTSEPGGGEGGSFDLTSDDIPVPSLQGLSASGAGLVTLYGVTNAQMRSFASYLWSPLFDVDTLKKLFNDPMDAIVSLGMIPFTPTGGTASNIFIGESDTGVNALILANQYYDISMGSLTLDEFYDSALDLNPYTKVELYLPYCGTISINPDEFDGKPIGITYHIDIFSGACAVFVDDGDRVLIQTQGNVLTQIPYTSKDFKQVFGAILGDAAAAGAALFALPTGGISAAVAVGAVGSAAMNSVNSKLNMPHGGQCASTAGFLSIQKPYLTITRPAQCLPENNADYQGYPAYITAKIGDLSGYIKISETHFDGFTCTKAELEEVERLLKEGVFRQ